MFPDMSVDLASNYCRNPDGRPEGPWCYTLDPDIEWESCGIVDCQGQWCLLLVRVAFRFSLRSLHSDIFDIFCLGTNKRDCLSSYYGDDYLGHKSTTLSGRTCQHWAAEEPHKHNFTDDDFPDLWLRDSANYCRNPDRRPGYGPWCYTIDPDVKSEFCGIPYCYETGKLFIVWHD